MPRARAPRPLAESPRLPALLVALAGAAGTALRWRAGAAWPLAAAAYAGLLSLSTLALFAWDKRRAARGARRVAESNLWWCALLGGAPGAWAGIAWRRHKTRRAAFRVGVPLLALAQGAALGWWLAA